MSSNIVLWHGARAWQGFPRVHPAKKGRLEGGPGIYLTTSLATARKYAKGGGVVMRFELAPDITWLEHSVLDLEDTLAMVSSLRGNKQSKQRVLDDLQRNASRTAAKIGVGRVHANVIVNLLVNADMLAGENGVTVAGFLAANGIHASLAKQDSTEDWVVVFDPTKIIQWSRVLPDEYWKLGDLPRIKA